ncbi:MAG: hypothetical protein LBO69_05885 [Ignavibacteria bacterium]|jgi:outer membrane lipoprotein-sorting protein|nr:hypothetical protein [Ignavibacteria bacterium]
MKKILILIAILTATYSSTYAETGREALEACATAMKYDKLDSFQTQSIKATIYIGDQRQTVKIFQKDSNLVRFETSAMGKEDAYVLTDDEFFQVKPEYEEFDVSEAGQLLQIYEMVLPTVHSILRVPDTNIVLTISGEGDYGGKKCKKIGISSPKTPDEISQYVYLDAQTNWLVGIGDDKGNGLVLSSMKKVKGFVYAATIKIMKDGKKQFEIEVNSFEANPELDDAIFAKP